MEGPTTLWLGMTLAAPVVLAPHIALLRLVHSKRSSWYPLDILIVSLLVGQLCCTTLTFAISAAALIRHAGLWQNIFSEGSRTPLCAALICGWTAAHTLQAATLTSLAFDRALTFRWPYKYRLSVRRTQIRYHVVVLAIISLMVGVAALFASSGSAGGGAPTILTRTYGSDHPTRDLPLNMSASNTNASHESKTMSGDGAKWDVPIDYHVARDGCAFMPHLFDSRFALFWLCLHGALFLATLAASMMIFVTWLAIRCCGKTDRFGLGSGSDLRTLGTVSDGSSGTLTLPTPAPAPPPRYTPTPIATLRHFTHPSESSTSHLARSNQNLLASEKPYAHMVHNENKITSIEKTADFTPVELTWNRQRHSTVAAVLIVAYATYHLPLLVSSFLIPFSYQLYSTL